jgi:peptidoglycan/xylan/chitin deacetylase (PgdA/CDA1 family)
MSTDITKVNGIGFRVGRAARRIALRTRATVQRHGLVLMYHRIATPSADPWGLAVSPAHFAEHLQVVARLGECVPVAHLPQALQGPGPHRLFAITFDDGYRDNALAAAPALQRAGMPATIFVVSGAVGTGRDFWWDMLARLLLAEADLPQTLSLERNGASQHFALGAASQCSPDELRRLAQWRAEDEAPWHDRQRLYLRLWRLLDTLAPAEAEALCTQLAAWGGIDRAGPALDHIMTAEELRQLAAGGLIEIGAHTESHLPLDGADPAIAAREIAQSREALSAMIGRPVTSFSYPFGRLRPETPRLVQDAGFAQACESGWRPAFAGVDRFRIPRIQVPDVDGDGFEAFVSLVAG